MKIKSKSPAQKLFPIAHNYLAPVNVEALTVKRKGRVIKGETEQAIAADTQARRGIKNALKAQRRSRRAA